MDAEKLESGNLVNFCATKMNVKEWSGPFCSRRVNEHTFGLFLHLV